MTEGNLNYRYEDLFKRMQELQWYNDGVEKKRREYLFGKIPKHRTKIKKNDGLPIDLYCSNGFIEAGDESRVHCCGSTISSVYLEMERKFMLAQTAKPPKTFKELYEAGGSERSRLPPIEGAKHWIVSVGTLGAQQGVEDFGIGFSLEHSENIRRGDVAQTWTGKTGGHSVFIWDVRVTRDGEIEYQQLSSQYGFTDGIGINKFDLEKNGFDKWDPKNFEYCCKVLTDTEAWINLKIHKNFYPGRFYCFFPYWPTHLDEIPDDRSGFGEDAVGNPLGQGGLLVGGPSGCEPPSCKETYYENNEGYENHEKRPGGFYPIGSNRTWHNGIHLYPKTAHAPIYAISDGVIIAARCPIHDDLLETLRKERAKKDKPLPSRNFVLIRHQVKIDREERVFFCLYMHLDASQTGKRLMESRWLWKLRNLAEDDPCRQRLDKGGVVHLAEAVATGDIVGHVAAPDQGDLPMFHWEIFSNGEEEPIAQFTRKRSGEELYKRIEDDNHDLFVDNIKESKPLYDIICEEMTTDFWGLNSVITEDEVCEFFHSNNRREDFRYFVCKHISEWSWDKIDWGKIKDTRRWNWAGENELERLKTSIKAYSWWFDSLCGHGGDKGLPKSHVVWTYNPVTFLAWLQEQVKDNPVGKQMEQDVKRFLSGAATGGKPKPDSAKNLWKILKNKGLVVFREIEPSKKLYDFKVYNYFKALEQRDISSDKFVRLTAWICVGKEGDNSGVKKGPTGGAGDKQEWELSKDRLCFEDASDSPGEIIQLEPKDPPDSNQCCVIRGEKAVQSGSLRNKDIKGESFDYIKIDGWVCVGTLDKPNQYAKPA